MKPTSFKIRFWLGLAIAAIGLVVPASAQAENVVPNPGFENNCAPAPTLTAICGVGGARQQVTAGPRRPSFGQRERGVVRRRRERAGGD